MRMISLRSVFMAAALSAIPFIAQAVTFSYMAGLKSSAKVPPNDSKGTGTVTAQAVLPIASARLAKPPVKFLALLSDADAAGLVAGKRYCNIMTAAHDLGEIRG